MGPPRFERLRTAGHSGAPRAATGAACRISRRQVARPFPSPRGGASALAARGRFSSRRAGGTFPSSPRGCTSAPSPLEGASPLAARGGPFQAFPPRRAGALAARHVQARRVLDRRGAGRGLRGSAARRRLPAIGGSEPMQNDQTYFFSNIFFKFYNIIKIII